MNAGLRLWQVQQEQGTGLCVGLDPHLNVEGGVDPWFYRNYGREYAPIGDVVIFERLRESFEQMLALSSPFLLPSQQDARLLSGVTMYMLNVIDVAWDAGVRVYKPQSAFYEQLAPFGQVVLGAIARRLHDLSVADGVRYFIIFDSKREDINSSMAPYYQTYLSDGMFNFDAMTVTLGMGEDILTPGIRMFKQGKGAVVVTRSSNPSGTTFQDAFFRPNSAWALSEKQERFRFSRREHDRIYDLIGARPTVHEALLDMTSRFSAKHGLDQDGVSPIFSVMGATTKMSEVFRKLRPGGIALIPGFGAQGGKFANVERLIATEGPLAGHWGILSSSRGHTFPWMAKFGGCGDARRLHDNMHRAVRTFREAERAAYEAAKVDYPFKQAA